MSPKEKAIELVERFKPYSDYQEDDCFSEVERMLINAKQCALIAVDEILNCPAMNDCEQVKYSDGSYAREYYEVPNKYWSKVKQEIEKL